MAHQEDQERLSDRPREPQHSRARPAASSSAERPSRRILRRVAVAIVVLLLAALGLAAVGPMLIPSSYLARTLRVKLEQACQRPVRVSDCHIGWLSGLRVGDIWIEGDAGAAGEPAVHVENLSLDYLPWELLKIIDPQDPNLGRIRIQRLTLNVNRNLPTSGAASTPAPAGAARSAVATEPAAPSAPPMAGQEVEGQLQFPPDFKSIEVADGTVNLMDYRTGRRHYVTNLNLTLGRLVGTQKVYITASGRLLFPDLADGAARFGTVNLDGLFDGFTLSNMGGVVGGCDIWWESVDLGHLLPPPPRGQKAPLFLSAPTDGQIKLSLDRTSRVRVDGSVSTPRFALEAAGLKSQVDIKQLTLAFAGSYDRETGRAALEPVQIFGAGSSLRITGRLDADRQGRLNGGLGVTGTLSLGPLKDAVRFLGNALSDFNAVTGTASIRKFDLKLVDNVVDVDGQIDLTRTELLWTPYFEKPTNNPMRFLLEARLNLNTRDLLLKRASLQIGDPDRDLVDGGLMELEITASSAGAGSHSPQLTMAPGTAARSASPTTPATPATPGSLPAAPGEAPLWSGAPPAAPAPDASTVPSTSAVAGGAAAPTAGPAASATPPSAALRPLELTIVAPNVQLLHRHFPVVKRVVEMLRLSGQLTVRGSVEPGQVGWPVAVQVDAQGLSFQTGPQTQKQAGTPLAIVMTGQLSGPQGLPECRQMQLTLGGSRIRFTGSAGPERIKVSAAAESATTTSTDGGEMRIPASLPEAVAALTEKPAAGRPYRERLRFSGVVVAAGLEDWLRLMRPYLPERPSLEMVGAVTCRLDGHLDQTAMVLNADLDASQASLELNPAPGRLAEPQRYFVKRLGQEAVSHLVVNYTAAADLLTVAADSTLGENQLNQRLTIDGLGGLATAQRLQVPRKFSLVTKLKSANLASLLANLPALAKGLEPYQVGGGLESELSCQVDRELKTRAWLDLTQTSYRLGDALLKKPGLTQAALLEFRYPLPAADRQLQAAIKPPAPPGAAVVAPTGSDSAVQAGGGTASPASPASPVVVEEQSQPAALRMLSTVPQAVVTLDNLSLVTGPASLHAAGWVGLDTDVFKPRAGYTVLPKAVRGLDLKLRLMLGQSPELLEFSKAWREFSARHEFQGQASAEAHLAGTRQGGELQLTADATAAGFHYGEGTRKPIGTEARVEVDLRTASLAGEIEVRKAAVDIADTHASARGRLYSRSAVPAGPQDIVGSTLHLEGRAQQLSRLARLLPLEVLQEVQPQGGIEFQIDMAHDPYGFEVRDGRVAFNQAQITFNHAIVALDGQLAFSGQHLSANPLKVRVGDSSLTLVAELERPFEAARGSIRVTGDTVNLDQALAIFGVEPGDKPAPVIGIPPTWPATSRFLGRMNVTGRLAFDRFIWSGDGLHYDWQNFVTDFSLGGGQLAVPSFKAAMLGGAVHGRLAVDLAEANPLVHSWHEARNISGQDDLRPMISKLFPGMEVAGQASQVQETQTRLFPTREQFNYPVGNSHFEATDGFLVGPGAPAWMTDLFPGLKLTRYDFKRMKSDSRMYADGHSENLMLYDGTRYSIYITGTTLVDGTADYTLGIDLFGSRVPLLATSGRIIDSKWEGGQPTIGYKLPHEVAYDVFLKRNLLNRLLSDQGETRRPDFKPYDFEKAGSRSPVPADAAAP